MEGVSTIYYQGKAIVLVDFSNSGKSKEITMALINAMVDEFKKFPLNSVLGLINMNNSFFHIDTLRTFKKAQETTKPYEKKVAVVGLKGLMKTGFNSVAGSSQGTVKSFDSEEEAKEWLISK